ncbi:alpha/beta fold hydrolase [Streptomyces sp. NRRL S-1868]|uniref:alpha/beta fold hydrolase n=1 Tax=Streptomyces sp. NRRL S-1868 TaxID=1463892 RepID=UPI0006917974|nr:alpha/beta hydrolase [Streptomyces sp. NRRL S-1868]
MSHPAAPHGPHHPTSPSFLLVPGAWHRAACWDPLRDALDARGRRSRTVELPSAGPQSTPTAGMYDDAEAIAAQLRRMEGPVIVVGHSYGGIPVTQAAADHPHVVHLVYLAAYMTQEGESLLSVHGKPTPEPEDEDLTGTSPTVFADPRTSLYSDLTDDQAEHAIGRLTEQSRRSFQQPVTHAAWRTVPSTYVLCERDQALPPQLQKKMSAHATHVEHLPTGHCPFLSTPPRLATLLTDIATATATESPHRASSDEQH